MSHKSAGSLGHRILNAAGWLFGGHFVGQLLRLVSNLFMTRLLVPDMFGIMALANVIMVGIAMLSDIGISQGIIQSKRGTDPVYLNTAWTLQILRGGVLWFIALLIAAGIYCFGLWGWLPQGSVYADPVLPYVIAVLSFSALIAGFVSTNVATANRHLALRQLTLLELVSQLSGLLLMVAWVLLEKSIWALVAGALLASVVRVLLSHVVLPGAKNYIHWDKNAFLEIFGFGKWIFLTSLLGFLSANGDRLILSGLIDPAALGLYVIALFLVGALQEVFVKLGGSVAFPAFSEVLRGQGQTLKLAYYKFRLPLDVATLVSAGLLFSAGHLLICFLYDARYQAAGPMVEILSISLFGVRFSLADQCFLAMGKPKLLVPIIVSKLLGLFVFLPFSFYAWGLEGAVWVAGGAILFALPVTIFLKIKHDLFAIWYELAVLPLLGVGYLLGLLANYLVSIVCSC